MNFGGNERPSLLPSYMAHAWIQSLRLLAPAKTDPRTRAPAPSVVKVDFQEFDPDHYKAIA